VAAAVGGSALLNHQPRVQGARARQPSAQPSVQQGPCYQRRRRRRRRQPFEVPRARLHLAADLPFAALGHAGAATEGPVLSASGGRWRRLEANRTKEAKPRVVKNGAGPRPQGAWWERHQNGSTATRGAGSAGFEPERGCTTARAWRERRFAFLVLYRRGHRHLQCCRHPRPWGVVLQEALANERRRIGIGKNAHFPGKSASTKTPELPRTLYQTFPFLILMTGSQNRH
jgi:hypothetical protein